MIYFMKESGLLEVRMEHEWPISYKDHSGISKEITLVINHLIIFEVQENRWSVDNFNSPGPKRTWDTHKFMTSLMGSAYTPKFEKINKSILRTMLGLRKYICSQFKPNCSKFFMIFWMLRMY